jgi:hypothetical protein
MSFTFFEQFSEHEFGLNVSLLSLIQQVNVLIYLCFSLIELKYAIKELWLFLFCSNFSHYKNRFTMPERTGKFSEVGLDMFYSFNVGPIHFISINTEYFYFMEVKSTKNSNHISSMISFRLMRFGVQHYYSRLQFLLLTL